MRTAELDALQELLERFGEEHPEVSGAQRLCEQVGRILEDGARRPLEHSRAAELADLRRAPLGNALFTRDSFEAEYGPAELVGEAEEVDLAGRAPGDRCIYCDGERATVETYATDRPGTQVRFWWCHGCGLGRAVSWGALREVAGHT